LFQDIVTETDVLMDNPAVIHQLAQITILLYINLQFIFFFTQLGIISVEFGVFE